ncbi:MAG: carboxypeptidase regulatory-like domain-containing protein [Gemmatimonadaceae bacterium]
MIIRLRRLSALFLAAGTAEAQVVRGVVRDSATQTPIPGVVVSLDEAVARLDTEGSLRRASLALVVLTDEQGAFAVRAGAAGRYVLSAKRVGRKRFESTAFQLNAGESLRMDIALSRIDFTALPTVSVTTDGPCSINAGESRRVAALWEEARTALTASRLALRDRLFRATIVRYTRELRPAGLRIVREEQVVHRSVTERPFVSLAADRLSADGYMQLDGDGGSTYYAPDAAVLTSAEFLRDHCFSLTRDRGQRGGMAGLAFRPIADRRPPDISGALWMDSATYELRVVEFRYTNIPDLQRAAEARGEVQFGHLPNGAWYVSKWFIRMPEFRAARPSPTVPIGGPPLLAAYKEEGGDVTVDGASTTARGATLTGRALDSTRRAPLRDAVVRLSGTRYAVPVNADGSFRLDSLPAGAFTLLLEHPAYAALGVRAAEQDLEIADGSSSVTVVQALGTEQLLRRLCGTGEFPMERAVARVRVLDRDGSPVRGADVRARFDTFERPNTGTAIPIVRPITDKVETDQHGAAMFCNLPAQQPVRFELAIPGSDERHRQDHKLQRHAIAVVTFNR